MFLMYDPFVVLLMANCTPFPHVPSREITLTVENDFKPHENEMKYQLL